MLVITGFFLGMSTQVKAVVIHMRTNAGEKAVIPVSYTCIFFCFNSHASNLYNNDVIIYEIKNMS